MTNLTVTRPPYAPVFLGAGFHNSEASTYRLIRPDDFSETVAKLYREIAPGFMRCFAGFSDWTEKAMDDFAEYYGQMQKVTDTPIYMTPGRGKLLFSDEEIDRYADDVAERLAYLIRKKDVRHILYYCFSNELGEVSGGALRRDLPRFRRLQTALYRAFQNHRLNVGLLATDGAQDWTSVDWAMENMDAITRDYCVHYYEHDYSVGDKSFYPWWTEKCAEMAKRVIRKQKHLILGEIGSSTANCALEGISVRDACSHYLDETETAYAALKLTEMIVGAVNAGVYALALWTFMDYPDPFRGPSTADEWGREWTAAEPFLGFGGDVRYNKWGLLRWDNPAETGQSCRHAPRCHYAALGIVLRALGRNVKILDVVSSNPDVRACAVMARDGSVRVVAVNRGGTREDLTVTLPRTAVSRAFRVTSWEARKPFVSPFADLPPFTELAERTDDAIRTVLPPESITVLTDGWLPREAPVTAEIVSHEGGVLRWKAVSDPRHCYYRVFRDGAQIRSTVALSCSAPDEGRYEVRSVDVDGNA